MSPLERLDRDVVGCVRCPRLIAHCRRVALEKRAAFRDEEYWGRPVPNCGDPGARVLVVGLAPAAHGANRTGRMFTGDRSGDWLFRTLHETGFANQPESVRRGDGLELTGVMVSAVAHCAPPANKPTAGERANCREYLTRTWDALPDLRVVVALGKVAYDDCAREAKRRGLKGRYTPFSHGAESRLDGLLLLASYHPSQQNTFTGKLTREMLRSVFERARAAASLQQDANTLHPAAAGRRHRSDAWEMEVRSTFQPQTSHCRSERRRGISGGGFPPDEGIPHRRRRSGSE